MRKFYENGGNFEKQGIIIFQKEWGKCIEIAKIGGKFKICGQ